MLEQKGLCTAEEWQRHHLQKDKPAGLGVVHYPQPIHQQGPLETSKVRTDYNNNYYYWFIVSVHASITQDIAKHNRSIKVAQGNSLVLFMNYIKSFDTKMFLSLNS